MSSSSSIKKLESFSKDVSGVSNGITDITSSGIEEQGGSAIEFLARENGIENLFLSIFTSNLPMLEAS